MNIRNWVKYIGFSATILAATAAHAESRAFMPKGGVVTPPPGFMDLCQRDDSACGGVQTFAALTGPAALVQPTSSVGGRPGFMSGGFLGPVPSTASTTSQTADQTPSVEQIAALTAYKPSVDADFIPAGEMRAFVAAPTAPVELAAQGAGQAANQVGGVVTPLPKDMLKMINAINRDVNREVHKATDFDLYGLLEYWSLPRVIDGKMYGDCEDYALEKRRRLIEAGVPAKNLSMAVAVTARGESHAVLVVAMENGDVVLDNLTPWATPWQDLNYHWVERQIAGGAEWVSIG